MSKTNCPKCLRMLRDEPTYIKGIMNHTLVHTQYTHTEPHMLEWEHKQPRSLSAGSLVKYKIGACQTIHRLRLTPFAFCKFVVL
ncbi:hypothetical protein AQUCO_08300087v1 [Aquilegia coerulea]|uniref:Uncharacterized protein n=1 Tax=Aquilegia coerulea TaxID=218851 RepID=A0A2G5C783_AQUCA|nr:hypothetical protein AQUCO_08300087v1 [Aquilegia coerulea]